MLDVALVTTRPLPEPDPDEQLLLNALADAGLVAEMHVWRDGPAAPARVVILRSPWDYHAHVEDFVAWCADAATRSRLFNPLPVVRWNVHKKYLLELDAADVAVVPTAILPSAEGAHAAAFLDDCAARFGDDLVCKPAVSAGSFQTWRTGHATALPYARQILADRDLMVQPWLGSVSSSPERSLVFIDGEYAHTMHKLPRLAGDDERVTGPHDPTEQELDLARRALALSPEPVLYGRVDLITDNDGRPVVSELELLEPSLFLAQSPATLRKLVAATYRLCRG